MSKKEHLSGIIKIVGGLGLSRSKALKLTYLK